MWGITAIAFFCVAAARGTSHEIRVACRETHGFPPIGENACPSLLKELKLELLTVGGEYKLNISWAVKIDGDVIWWSFSWWGAMRPSSRDTEHVVSVRHLTGTRLIIDYVPFLCEYDPPFAEAHLDGSLQQVWFYHVEHVFPGLSHVQAANLPKHPPGSGLSYQEESLTIPSKPPAVTPTVELKSTPTPTTAKSQSHMNSVHTGIVYQPYFLVTAILGGLVGLMALASCFIIYKAHRKYTATSLGFTKLPTTPIIPVSVLLVYPAETPAFQKAVVALAEFLQCHGGCRVAVDMWQQVRIAQLGPMRWLAEQAKSADRVIVICPQPNHCPTSDGFQEYSVPVTAQDLYLLVLNMVASYARSPGEMAKFWTVRLGETQDEKPSCLAVELRACKSFHLMRDLDKLCTSLRNQRQDSEKTLGLKIRSGVAYSETSTVKLRDAIGQLDRSQSRTTGELEPLKSVITNA